MKKTKRRAKLLLVLLILCISIGYAVLQSNLTINGTTGINNPTWDIHWEHVSVTTGSVTGTNVTTPATIDSVKTTVNYNIKLPKPGDFYEFTVDAVNDGTIDAMIDTIDSKLNGTTITSLPSYLTYSVTYSDGSSLQANQELKADTSETYKVRIEFKKDIDNSQLPSTVQSLNLSFSVVYKQANNNAIAVDHSMVRYTVNIYNSNLPNDNQVLIGQPIAASITQYLTAAQAMEALTQSFASVNYENCLKHKIENGVVEESYVVFIVTSEMANEFSGLTPGTYEIRGGVNENSNDSKPIYETNKMTLLNAFDSSYCSENIHDDGYHFECYAEGIYFQIDSCGLSYFDDNVGGCGIDDSGVSSCFYN